MTIKIFLIWILILLVIMVNLKLQTNQYYIISLIPTFIIVIITILCAPVHIYYRIIVLIIFVGYYKRFFDFILNFFLLLWKLLVLHPIEKRYKDYIVRTSVKKVWGSVFCLKENFSHLPNTPSIIVSNYVSDRMENMACIMLPVNLTILMRDYLKTMLHLGKIVKNVIYTKKSGNYDSVKSEITEHINKGNYIFAYVTQVPKDPSNISKVRKGMINIAKSINIPITPVCFDYIDIIGGTIPRQNYHIRIGDTFFVQNEEQSLYKIRKFFKTSMSLFIKEKYV